MTCSTRNMKEMPSEIHIVGKDDFRKPVIYSIKFNFLFTEPNNNETTEPITELVCDKSIREEPYIDVDKKSTLSKVDSKGTVSSVRSGTQVRAVKVFL